MNAFDVAKEEWDRFGNVLVQKCVREVRVVSFGNRFAVCIAAGAGNLVDHYVDRNVDLGQAASSARVLRSLLLSGERLLTTTIEHVLAVAADPVGFIPGKDFVWQNLDRGYAFRVAVKQGIEAHADRVLYGAHPNGSRIELPIEGRREAIAALVNSWGQDPVHGMTTHFGVSLDREGKIAVDTLETR